MVELIKRKKEPIYPPRPGRSPWENTIPVLLNTDYV